MNPDPALLAKLEDPETPVAELSDLLLAITSVRPSIRIDLAEEPVPAVASIGPLMAEGPTADDALRNLAAVFLAIFTEAQEG